MKFFWIWFFALTTLVLADPLIYPVDHDGDGWWEWTSLETSEKSFRSPGLAALALKSERSTEWLAAQARRLPYSAALISQAADALSQEESLSLWKRAETERDGDHLLLVAHRFYRAGRWGDALKLVSLAHPPWFKTYASILKTDPTTARLFENGWELEEEGLRRGDLKLSLGPSEGVDGKPLRVGDRTGEISRSEGVVTLPHLGLSLRLSRKSEVDRLASELAGAGGVTEVLGTSVEGREIVAHWLGSGPEVVTFFGAFHGDEPESVLVVENFRDYLREHPELLEGKTAVFLPVVNPDGLEAEQRKNAREVDLNRNFPTSNWNSEGKDTDYWGGPSAASEPETRIVVDLLERFPPARIISVHCPYRCVNYDGPAEELAELIADANGYEVKPSIGYATPGSFGTYAGIERKIPTITLELPPTGEEDVWNQNREAMVRALRGE